MTRRVLLSVVSTLALLCAIPAVAWAAPLAPGDSAWTGSGMRVCATPGTQSGETAVADGAGGVFIGWWDSRNGTFDVYLQHLSGAGVPSTGWPTTGRLLRADAYTYPDPAVHVVPDGAGGVIVGWLDNRARAGGGYLDVYAQRVAANGTVLWADGGVRVTESNTVYFDFDMSSDGAGGALIAWEDARSPSRPDHAYAQRINGSGQSLWAVAGVSTNVDTTAAELGPIVIPDGAGGAIVCWQEGRVSNPTPVKATGSAIPNPAPDRRPVASVNHYSPATATQGGLLTVAQRLNASGVPQWPDTGLVVASADQPELQIVPDGLGGAIVSTPGSVRRWNAAGTMVWGAAVPFTDTGGSAKVSIMADGAGGAIAAWANNTWSPAADSSIYAEHFNASGSPQWSWPRVCSGAKAWSIAMIPDNAGGSFLVWEDGRSGPGTAPPTSFLDIYAQRVGSTGAVAAGWSAAGLPVCTADSAQRSPAVVTDGAGGAILVWTDWRNPSTDLYAAKITNDGTVPTLLSLVSADALPGHVRLRWFSGSGGVVGASLYRQTGEAGWRKLASLTADGTGEISFDDTDVVPGQRYGYRLGVMEAGVERFLGEVWVEMPATLRLALEAPRPNPTSGALMVSLTLPTSTSAFLDLLDVAGRRIARREVGSLGPGRHVIDLSRGATMPTGIYSIRLTQAGRSAAVRAAVLR